MGIRLFRHCDWRSPGGGRAGRGDGKKLGSPSAADDPVVEGLYRIFCGGMSRSTDDFWHLPFDELMIQIEGWREYHLEIPRHFVTVLVNLWTKQKVQPQDILPLASDKRRKRSGRMDKKTLEAVRAHIRKEIKERNEKLGTNLKITGDAIPGASERPPGVR